MWDVCAATCAISTSGLEDASDLPLWCSDIQKREYPHRSASCANRVVSARVAIAERPSLIWEWSSTLSFKLIASSLLVCLLSQTML